MFLIVTSPETSGVSLHLKVLGKPTHPVCSRGSGSPHPTLEPMNQRLPSLGGGAGGVGGMVRNNFSF